MTSQTTELCRNLLEALNPVRDITKNWGIDLAQHLEQYLEQIAIDHDGMPMNFAEAALLIQNSTTIYSKKVDYIWDIMQCVLANIHKKKTNTKSTDTENETGHSESKSEDSTKRKSRKHFEMDRSKYGEINTEISNKMLDLESTKEKRKPWKFIPTIYHQFQKKSISRKKRYIYAAPDDPFEERQFKVNQVLLHYKMLHHEFKDEDVTPDAGNCFQNNHTIRDQNFPFPSEHMDDSISHGGDDLLENVQTRLELDALDHVNEASIEVATADAAVRRERDNIVNAPVELPNPPPVVDAWNPIPFDQGTTEVEIGHRKTTKLPCSIELLEPPENGKRKKGKEIMPKKQKLLSKYLQLKSLLSKDVRKQFLIDEDFLQQRDIILGKKVQKKRPKFEEIRYEVLKDFDEFADFYGFEDYEPVNGEGYEGFLGFDDNHDPLSADDDDIPDGNGADIQPLNIDIPLPPTDHLTLLANDAISRSPGSSTGISRDCDPGNAFEEMCLERIQPEKTTEEIIRGQVDLAKRVAHWHDSIKSKLAASEKRAHFDIHGYGTQILNTFPRGSSAKLTLPLSKVLENVDTQDVSRYFLATLQLANTYNVELNTPGEPLVMDQVELTLLTASRLHEDLDNYIAPSQERTSLSGTSRSPGSTSFQFAQPSLPRPKTTTLKDEKQRKRKL